MALFKPREREAISAWWARSYELQGAAVALAGCLLGLVLGTGIFFFASAFTDLN